MSHSLEIHTRSAFTPFVQYGTDNKENSAPTGLFLSQSPQKLCSHLLRHSPTSPEFNLERVLAVIESRGDDLRREGALSPNKWLRRREEGCSIRYRCNAERNLQVLIPGSHLGEGCSRTVKRVLFACETGAVSPLAETSPLSGKTHNFAQEVEFYSNLYPDLEFKIDAYLEGDREEQRLLSPCFKKSLCAHMEEQELDRSTIANIVRKIAEDLARFHDRGYVHADLNVRNVCVNEEGTPFLIDLADAQRVGSESPFFGDEEYCAPELLGLVECQQIDEDMYFGSDRDAIREQFGLRPRSLAVDGKRDIWALGVMALEMLDTSLLPGLTGACSRSLFSVGREPLHDNLGQIKQKVSAHEDPLARIVCDMLSFDPAQRPSAEEVMRALS